MADQRFLTGETSGPAASGFGSGILYAGIVLIMLLLNGCAGATTFRVLDAETKQPIQGAVAIAMWYRIEGMPGLTSTHTARAVETESDASGFFTIPGSIALSALGTTPHLKVYKPGYVGWDSGLIYLGCREDDITRALYQRRENFSMKDQDIYLEPWKEEYSFISHESIIGPPLDFYEAGLENSKYRDVIKYEIPFRVQEREILRKKR